MVIWSYGEKPYWSGFRGGRDEDSSGWGDDGNMRANGRNNGIVGRGEVGGWGEDRRGGGQDRDRLERGGGGRDRDRNGRRPQRSFSSHTPSPSPRTPSTPRYKCYICPDLWFRDNYNLQRHNKIHDRLHTHNPIICGRAWCSEEFSTTAERKAHMDDCVWICPEPLCNKTSLCYFLGSSTGPIYGKPS